MNRLSQQTNARTVITFTDQPALRPALPCVYGPQDYREQRSLFQRIDAILSASGHEQEFIALTLVERMLDQLPAAIKQAHERIIGGRRVANEDKILSLYDGDINVI